MAASQHTWPWSIDAGHPRILRRMPDPETLDPKTLDATILDATILDLRIKELAQGRNFGTICVHLPDGTIASHVMWLDASDEHLLINTEVHRAKYRAVTANPSVTVTVWDQENPYRYGEVRGRVVGETRGPEARAHIDTLSNKYKGTDYQTPIQSERVILRITPERQRCTGL
jgi:PPOX class probable F420-dependent enzyme